MIPVSMIALVAILALAGCRLDSGSGLSNVEVGDVPAPPTNVSLKAQNTSITVSWPLVSEAEGYYVYSSSSEDGSYDRVGIASSTQYTVNSLYEGTRYYFKVSSWNSAGEGSQSSSVSTITIPATPTGVTATTVSSNSIRVSWNEVKGASSYRIYCSYTSSGAFGYIGRATSSSYTDNSLDESTTYHYKVSAYNSSGESYQSASATASTWAK